MKQIIFSLLLILFVTSCNTGGKKTTTQEEVKKLSFTSKEYKKTSEIPNAPQSEVKATIPFAEGDSVVAKKINDRVFEVTKSTIAQEGDTSSDYDSLFSAFISQYEKFIKEFPDSPGGWEAIIKGSVEYDSPEIVNIKLDVYSITGGAHGNSNQHSLIFDPKTGKELSITDLVTGTTGLNLVAEEYFRKKYEIPLDKSINSTGYSFENDKFSLPKNIFITHDGLLLHYNAYEIASYAEGVKEVLIPYYDINDYLAIKIK